MPQTKPLSLSDIIRDPDAIVNDFTELSDDDDIEYVKEYGLGIDSHSKFIEIYIRYRNGNVIQKAQSHFSINWDDLITAHDWCIDVLKTEANPIPDLSEPLHYTPDGYHNIESYVCFPVYIKAYNRKSGDHPSYTLNIQNK